jgi:hypothetical protein
MSSIAYKLVILLKARKGLALDTFADAWLSLEACAPNASEGLVRAVFARPFTGPSPIVNAPTAPFDAALETWWRREGDAFGWAASHEFEHHWLPQRMALLAGRPAAIGGQPQVIREHGQPVGLSPVTVLVLPVARRSLGFAAFVQHWTGPHARLALQDPHAGERLVRLEDTPAATSPPAQFEKTRYDGVGALTFASAQALAASFSSQYYREHLAPDERRFTDPVLSAAFLTQGVELR